LLRQAGAPVNSLSSIENNGCGCLLSGGEWRARIRAGLAGARLTRQRPVTKRRSGAGSAGPSASTVESRSGRI